VDAFDEAVAGYDGNCTADCTLRDAITMANSNPGSDIIEVPIGSPDIILAIAGASEDNNTTGDHDIWDTLSGQTLTIRLNGTGVVNQAGVAHRLFHALATGAGRHAVTRVIENGQVESGHAMNQPGGCVYAEEGPLVLDDVRFRFCDSEWIFAGVTGGGAVAALGGATITDSAFNDSQVTDADGGAVYVEGDLEITDTTFEDNIIVGPTGRGGAVRCDLAP